ncbi:MAG: CBS domain-containing protein [Betaproteobacteria bacterium RIFCSPLOWO2_12_FULL_63_13]|nr:MAG: CBS domain-containing protein [Betaproteobacteria bacterium RIFCSPLOWO2_02_FULL_63_19]OGA45428.1 MAG: CBS domain-containing protein [Betaproteobacteria bacterium RIFCSPLOWO2_12_FULL_63_13]
MKTRDILRVKGEGVLHTVAPDSLLSHAVGVMVEQDIGSLVVMEHGKLVGMITFREVLKALHANNGSISNLFVRDMTSKPETVGSDVDVDDLRRLMLETHTRYVPVVEGGAVSGVLSFHDVAKAMLEEQAFENRMLKGYITDSAA